VETEAVGALLEVAPCLTAGKPDSEVLTGVFRAAALHGLAVEQLEQCDLEKKIPWLRCCPGWQGVLVKEACILHTDR